MQTVYKHWFLWMRELAQSPQLPPQTNIFEVKSASELGIIEKVDGGYALTDLGVKVIQTADLMEELKKHKLKLSW